MQFDILGGQLSDERALAAARGVQFKRQHEDAMAAMSAMAEEARRNNENVLALLSELRRGGIRPAARVGSEATKAAAAWGYGEDQVQDGVHACDKASAGRVGSTKVHRHHHRKTADDAIGTVLAVGRVARSGRAKSRSRNSPDPPPPAAGGGGSPPLAVGVPTGVAAAVPSAASDSDDPRLQA